MDIKILDFSVATLLRNDKEMIFKNEYKLKT